MAKAKNAVIAGDYLGKGIVGGVKPGIVIKLLKQIDLNHETVETYEVITDEHRKSAASGVARGLVGGALLGPVGMLAGSLSAKSNGIYQVAIQFKDGKKSLIEVDDKTYKAIVKQCF
ncbi:MAG: hypothetical protein ACOCNB_11720 [Acetivibrio ethanolgignens]